MDVENLGAGAGASAAAVEAATGHGPVAEPPVVATPGDAGAIADAAAWDAVHARQAVLESRLARAEEENRAFVRTLRHAAAAAEELLDEARSEAEALVAEARSTAEALVAEARSTADALVAEAQVAAEGMRAQAERSAATQLAEAQVAAEELVAVARVDARDAFTHERAALAETRAALVASEQAIAADRTALVRLHGDLTGGLRALARAMSLAVDQPAASAAGVVPVAPVAPVFAPEPAAGAAAPADQVFAATVRTGPQNGPEPAYAAFEAADFASHPDAGARAETRHDEEHLERAFDAFFSSEIEHEPSRRWILED